MLSHALYPKVFSDWKDFQLVYGNVANLPTNLFLHPMKACVPSLFELCPQVGFDFDSSSPRRGEEFELNIEEGRNILVKMVSIGDADASGTRQVILELNGERWFVPVTDSSSSKVRC